MRVNRREPWDEETPKEAFIRTHWAGERRVILRKIKHMEWTSEFDWVAEVAREGELAGQPVSDTIRRYAVRAAATLGPPADVFSLLVEIIGDSETPSRVRSKAVSILTGEDEWATDERLWPALEAFVTDPDVSSRKRQAFAFLRDEDPARALDLATDILNDRQDGPGSVAVNTLTELSTVEDESLVETLEALVRDETVDVPTREEAFEALREHGPDRAVALARSLLTGPDWNGPRDLYLELIDALAGRRDEANRAALRSVVTDTDRSNRVRSKAVDALADSGVPSDVEVILKETVPRRSDGLSYDPDTLSFNQVATALTKFESERAERALDAVATESKVRRRDREAAIEGLATARPERAVPALAEVLAATPERADHHHRLAKTALDALGQLATPSAVDVLASVLLSEQTQLEDSSDGDKLNQIDVKLELVEGVEHYGLRRHAARELGEVGDERAVPALCATLTSYGLGASEGGAYRLATAIADIGTEDAFNCLQTAIQAEITPATTYACAGRIVEFGSTHVEAEVGDPGGNLVVTNRPSTVSIGIESLVAALERAYDHLSATRANRATTSGRLRKVAGDIGLLRAEADLEAAIADVEQYERCGYAAPLVEPALDRAVDTGELAPVWELVEAADTCWRVMDPLIAGLVERVEQLGPSAVGELILWLLDPGTGTPPSDRRLRPLHDEPTVILNHLYNERRDEFKSVVLARLRDRYEGAEFLPAFGIDADVREAVQTTLSRMPRERFRKKLLETLETMDADAAADMAVALLREGHLDWTAINLLLDRDDDRVVGPLRGYLDRETRPETVGSLAVALRTSPADRETVFDTIRDKYRDPRFYCRLQNESEGYQTGLHDSRRSENPKHLITHLYELDQDRTRSVLRNDLDDCAATELRLDILAALQTVLSESAWLACCRSLRDDPDPRVKYAALRSLAQHQNAAAVETIAQLVTEPGLTLAERKEAVTVIGAAGTADVTTHLIDIVESDHKYDVRGDADAVRWVVIRELARLETPTAIEYLAQLQERADGLGQAAAAATDTQ